MTEKILKKIDTIIQDKMILSSFFYENLKFIEKKNKVVFLSFKDENTLHHIKPYKEDILAACQIVFNQNDLKINCLLSSVVVTPTISQTPKPSSGIGKNIITDLTLENFFVTNYSKNVYSAAKAVVQNCGNVDFNPLFIYGGSGLGKTHLLNGIGNELVSFGKSVLMVSANKFVNEYISNAKNNGLNELRKKYLKFDVLMIDDIQGIGNKPKTLGFLFNIYDQLTKNKKQIILVSDTEPDLLGFFTERLKNRFKSGLVLKLENPSFEDLKKILKILISKKFKNSVKWKEDVFNFIIRNSKKDIRSLEGSIKLINFMFKNKDGVLTLKELKHFFSNSEIDENKITPSWILKKVSDYYKISKSDITGRSRRQIYTTPRNIAVYFIKKLLDLSYNRIGEIFSNRNHSSIIACYKQIEKLKKINNQNCVVLNDIEKMIRNS